MNNERRGSLGCILTIILFLAASSTKVIMAGRPHLFQVKTARTRSNATILTDESKVTLVFCEKRYGCGAEWPKCYCCMTTNKCYQKQSECRAACLRCNPKCLA
ncbi:hypothetical protein BDA96_01G543000 [Sorghum bicolor]|uniref:Embryo surrounding factor 1 brassicaceae domain-containing protein n=1 Tax=Sorghum bicolor TaxID=4558 RepID=A0A921S966_SORBI|nr:hypothetical protein BDA96_01G543000 [Sorghum bicolor]